MEKNKPIRTYKAGGVKASVFENKAEYNGKQTTMYRVALDKTYKDSNGNWKSTSSFNATTELNRAILVLQKAYEFCVKLEEKTNGDNKDNGDVVEEEYIE
ncbi:MAG: hypothetical protein HOC71_02875 [Candidatus Latescibacteria bacterium]|jgi:hypothetical protein|nr:hypothetical protein [Candidatus Latescibacterota bacterium]